MDCDILASGAAYFLQPLARKYEKCAVCTWPRVGAPKLFLAGVGVRPVFGQRACDGPAPRLSCMPRAFKHMKCESCEVEINKLTTMSNQPREETAMDQIATNTVSHPPLPPPSNIRPVVAPRETPTPPPTRLDTNKYGLAAAVASGGVVFHMAVHKGPPDDVISSTILSQQSWEPEVCQTLTSMFEVADVIRKPSNGGTNVFVDVGANIGFHTLCVSANKRC